MTHLNKSELRDIPNQDGYEIKCIVKKNPIGCHGVYDMNNNPIFMRLESWRKNVHSN